MTHADLIATVGRIPLVELRRLAKDLPGRILAKLEMRNPCGNISDRVAVALVQDAESRGLLKTGMTIVEATGGNTGIGLAFVCAIRGYRLILTMPETLSVERVALLRQLGAEVVLTPGIPMIDAVAQAQKIANELPGAVILDQFRNPANPEIHMRTTAMEIWQDTQGAAMLSCLPLARGEPSRVWARFLNKRDLVSESSAWSPPTMPSVSGGVGFVPDVLNRSILDEVIAVTDEHAFSCARRLAREEGIIAGVSSGAAVQAALANSRTARRRREDHRGDSSRHGRKVYHHELVFPQERSSLSDELARKDSAKLTWTHEPPFPRRMFRRTDADSCDVRCYAARPPGTVDHGHRRARHVESIRGYRSSDSRGENGLGGARDDHPGAWPRSTL